MHIVDDGRLLIRSLLSIAGHVLLTNGIFFGQYDQFQSMLVIGNAFEYSGLSFVDQRYSLRVVRSILIDVGRRLWFLNQA